MKTTLLALPLLLVFADCNRGAPEAPAAGTPARAPEAPRAEAPRAEAKAPGHFGAPLSAAPAVAAAAVLAEPQKYDDQDVKLTGQVGAVCQKKGCWLTLGSGAPGERTLRVTFKDYGFFVPKDSLGKQAVVEGHFKLTTLSQAEAQHYADDAAKAGAPPKKVSGPEQTLALVATGVEMR